ncbi:MAG: response regulator [Acidobacteriota bacterium]
MTQTPFHPSIRIVVADDQAIVRRGIASLLSLTEGFRVVGEAANGIEALELAGRLRPDVILMDLAMPVLNGLEAVRKIKAETDAVRIIMLSSHDAEEDVMNAIAAGADGYLLKTASPELLADVVGKAVSGGDGFISPSFPDDLIEALKARLEHRRRQARDLTPREREVLQLIAEGRTHQEIAEILHLSIRTVDTHRNNLMQKLDIHDAVALVRYAMKEGLTRL